MSVRAMVYAAAAILAVAGVVAISFGLYRGGSLALPGWTKAVVPGPLSVKHAFLSDKCETCHTPTKGVAATTCISCHATAATALGKQSTAFHAATAECRGCHVEHAGGVRPIRMNHAALLRSTVFAGAPARTATDQMVSDIREFLGLAGSGDREGASLDCAGCHSNREPHRALFGPDCAGCHGLNSWKIAGFLHPSPASKDCAQCHQAPPSHYMGHFVMMDRMMTGQMHATVDQCFLCHRTDSFNDIKGLGWLKHH